VKTLYYVIIFLAMFQMSALMLYGLDVFPQKSMLYSDFDLSNVENISDPQSMLSYIFFPDEVTFGGIDILDYKIGVIQISTITIIGIITTVIIGGAILARATQTYATVVLAVIGILFYPMIRHSFGFFRELFMMWNSSAMMFMGVTLGVGIFILFILLIVETPTQGAS
jgi:hypothetical protein